MRTNEERAKSALAGLAAYVKEKGGTLTAGTKQADMVDLITDLLHLQAVWKQADEACDEPESVLAAVANHFLAENTHEVLVGNIGTVYRGSSEAKAKSAFDSYKAQSQAGEGRAANEPVSWLLGDDIHQEYYPEGYEA